MSEEIRENSRKKKKTPMSAILCRIIGTLILLGVIAACIPVTAPRLFDYEIYHVVSGSMEPTIPVGSVVYVQAVEPGDVASGDIIAFTSGDSVIVHRVVENWTFEGNFTTKGDANEGEDLNEVPYEQLIGVVKYHIPILGQLLMVLTSRMGKLLMICLAACGALLNVIAGQLGS
ncbi:MAG: signal peptidase I [Lachnospiraceae bacterium]|nr:signal peptidase I [Lachnospiraceae bacterium]